MPIHAVIPMDGTDGTVSNEYDALKSKYSKLKNDTKVLRTAVVDLRAKNDELLKKSSNLEDRERLLEAELESSRNEFIKANTDTVHQEGHVRLNILNIQSKLQGAIPFNPFDPISKCIFAGDDCEEVIHMILKSVYSTSMDSFISWMNSLGGFALVWLDMCEHTLETNAAGGIDESYKCCLTICKNSFRHLKNICNSFPFDSNANQSENVHLTDKEHNNLLIQYLKEEKSSIRQFFKNLRTQIRVSFGSLSNLLQLNKNSISKTHFNYSGNNMLSNPTTDSGMTNVVNSLQNLTVDLTSMLSLIECSFKISNGTVNCEDAIDVTNSLLFSFLDINCAIDHPGSKYNTSTTSLKGHCSSLMVSNLNRISSTAVTLRRLMSNVKPIAGHPISSSVALMETRIYTNLWDIEQAAKNISIHELVFALCALDIHPKYAALRLTKPKAIIYSKSDILLQEPIDACTQLVNKAADNLLLYVNSLELQLTRQQKERDEILLNESKLKKTIIELERQLEDNHTKRVLNQGGINQPSDTKFIASHDNTKQINVQSDLHFSGLAVENKDNFVSHSASLISHNISFEQPQYKAKLNVLSANDHQTDKNATTTPLGACWRCAAVKTDLGRDLRLVLQQCARAEDAARRTERFLEVRATEGAFTRKNKKRH